MDTIDFNKHDVDIFINLAKIVRYGWDYYTDSIIVPGYGRH